MASEFAEEQGKVPHQQARHKELLGDVDVIIDVIHAVAVVARAAGAVTEVQVGEVHISPAADGALMCKFPILEVF